MDSLHTITLAGFLGAGTLCDIRTRRIPNRLIALCTLAAFGHAVVTGGVAGLCWSGIGFLVGVSLLVGPFALGYVGAGDAKFLGGIGAFLGPRLTLHAFVAATILGALPAISILWKTRRRGGSMPDGRRAGWTGLAPRGASIPYAPPLALGTALTLARSWVGG